ncbi:MAG: tRNA preQ1(34) S-adenosylmethionine ribosyltransferase-isomerase QueA [Pseudomonadota bacterium]
MKLSDFHFRVPPELIAQQPSVRRSDSRLLEVHRDRLRDHYFRDLPTLLHAGDVLVINNTKVIKARLMARKRTGGGAEILVERILSKDTMLVQIRTSKKVKEGGELVIGETVRLTVKETRARFFLVEISGIESCDVLLEQFGRVPLPPYIERDDDEVDSDRYQTVFAAEMGAVAAPTAGLHFDQQLLQCVHDLGVSIATITLHVGLGTFEPIREEDVRHHKMHSERFEISADTAAVVNAARRAGGRVIAVGTTSLRALESSVSEGELAIAKGETDLYITPGFEFRIVDALITNFHLPQTSLLVLVSAFCGWQRIKRAYEHAITNRYRFYSYGDAMWLERSKDAF